MGFLLEIVFEAVFQFVAEVVLETGSRGLGRLLSSRIGRGVIGLAALVVACGGGWWWGRRLAGAGHTGWPTALWISVGLTVVSALLAVLRRHRAQASPRPSTAAPASGGDDLRVMVGLAPWRWPPGRLVGFAILNAAVATGVVVGIDPAWP